MKLLLVCLLSVFSLATFSETAKKKKDPTPVKMLTPKEMKKIKNKTSVNTPLHYGPNVKLDKEVTIKEYYNILLKMEPEASMTQTVTDLRQVYKQLSQYNPDQLLKIPTEIKVYECTGDCTCNKKGMVGRSVCATYCYCLCCPVK